jgi:hypothetical protein
LTTSLLSKAIIVNKVQTLFSNPIIRDLLMILNDLYFEIRTENEIYNSEIPEGKNELYFYVDDIVVDLDRLKIMFDLFSEVLNQLCHLDSAYENDPNLLLK